MLKGRSIKLKEKQHELHVELQLTRLLKRNDTECKSRQTDWNFKARISFQKKPKRAKNENGLKIIKQDIAPRPLSTRCCFHAGGMSRARDVCSHTQYNLWFFNELLRASLNGCFISAEGWLGAGQQLKERNDPCDSRKRAKRETSWCL